MFGIAVMFALSTVSTPDPFKGWTCTVTSLVQQSDERAGRPASGAAQVRVCVPARGGK